MQLCNVTLPTLVCGDRLQSPSAGGRGSGRLNTTDLSHRWCAGREHWPLVLPPWCGVYDGADYTTFILQKPDFVRGICVCGLYAYAGYMRENTVY